MIAKRAGYGIKELPVRWYNDADSRVKILSDSIRTLGELFYVWGVYGMIGQFFSAFEKKLMTKRQKLRYSYSV